MKRNNQSEKPIEELLRGIPQNHRICVPFQWAEDGRETGHHYIPVGRHVHQAADKITTLREQLKDCSAVVDRQQEMLDRNAEQLAALRDELTKCKVALADRDSAWRLYSEAREAEVQQASRAYEAVAERDKVVAAFAHLQSFVSGNLQEHDAAEVASMINAALKEEGK